jgi:hypothetical protein
MFVVSFAFSLRGDEDKSAVNKAPDVQLPVGYIVNVPLPLTGDADERIISQIRSIVDQPKDSPIRPVVVLHFKAAPKTEIGNVASEPKAANQVAPIGNGSSFERALSLARFLASPDAAGIKAVAF